MSRFSQVKFGPPIEVSVLNERFEADTSPNKINLGIGTYRTNEGQTWVMPVVRTAEKALAADETLDKEYLPVLGLESFTTTATKLLLGADSPAIKENRAFGIQTVSGAGALRLGAEFLARTVGYPISYISKETWESHRSIFPNAGFKELREYRYWSNSNRGLDFEGLLEDLNNAPENSVILLHVCAHNPTGCDPTREQWVKIADVIQERKLFTFFDSVYHGLASGDLETDAWAVKYFISRGFELLCAQSFAKNFTLYNERAGNLIFVVKDTDVIPKIKSQVTFLIRGMYSNAPSHGARIVTHILNNPTLCEQWKGCITVMTARYRDMRAALREALERLNTPGNWSHLTSQIGMFSYIGLDEKQSLYLADKHHIFKLPSGRINICGLTPDNIEYVANAINDAVLNVQ